MALYDQATLGVSGNQITFNDFNSTPIYRVRSRQPQQRNIRDLDLPIPFENGISDFETLIGRVAYILEGTMYPGNEQEYDEGLRGLRKVASLEFSQNDANTDNGYVPYVWKEANGNERQLFLKVMYVSIEQNTRQGLVQPFTLVCKIKDPTIFGATLKSASTEGADPTTSSGSAEFPVELPVVFGASTYSVSSSADNEGDLSTYPASIVINGPVNKPKVTNSTSGEYIEIDTNLATSSDVLTITYDKDTLSITKNGTSVLPSVTSGTTYFKLQPGTNNFNLTGTSIGSGAYVKVNYRDAWPLS